MPGFFSHSFPGIKLRLNRLLPGFSSMKIQVTLAICPVFLPIPHHFLYLPATFAGFLLISMGHAWAWRKWCWNMLFQACLSRSVSRGIVLGLWRGWNCCSWSPGAGAVVCCVVSVSWTPSYRHCRQGCPDFSMPRSAVLLCLRGSTNTLFVASWPLLSGWSSRRHSGNLWESAPLAGWVPCEDQGLWILGFAEWLVLEPTRSSFQL